jgi:hypothetical protein
MAEIEKGNAPRVDDPGGASSRSVTLESRAS